MNARNGACITLCAVLLCVSTRFRVSLAGREVRSPEHSLAASPAARPADPVNVSASGTHSRAPVMAVSANAVHLLWEEGNRVYHRMSRSGAWASARSVATGEQPSVALDASGTAHAAFVNEFGDNYEVYYCRWNGSTWSLPRNVSNTSGVSSSPGIAVGPDGVLHVVWSDNTPGYSVIYYAHWDGTYWLNEPIPHATGGAPRIAVSADGVVHVVWQDRDAPELPYEVYYSRWDGQKWSLPEDLSDSMAEQSVIPAITTDQTGHAHVTWQERLDGHYAVYYTYGRVAYWSVPERVSGGTADAYLPGATVRPGGAVYVGWDESTSALYRARSVSGAWSQPSTVLSDPLGVADLCLVVDVGGLLHAAWSERVAADNWEVFYQCLSKRLVLPVVIRSQSP